MKAVIQRVREAKVEVNSKTIGQIKKGVLVLLSVGKNDTPKDADYLVNKLIELRIFEDANGKMNLSGLEINAEFLIVSQFTLHGDCRRGRRPSFDPAASPEKGEELYNYFVQALRLKQVKVETGEFGAMMDVTLVNEGPVTFILESPSEYNN